MHSLPRSSLNPFQMIYANILQNVLFSKYFCANINSLCTLSLGPLSTFSSCFMAICYKIFLCANIVSQISNYHLSLNPRAFFQLFPGAFCEYFTKYVCANIVLQILINYALNPTAISQLLYANILQTRSYAALRQTYTGSSGQDTVGAGTFWGVLNVSLRASGTQLGLDLTCFVIRHPSSDIPHPSFVIRHLSSVIRHPLWKKLDDDEM